VRRVLLYVSGWLAAVVIATAVGFAAISLVGDDVGAPAGGVALVASPDASGTAAGPATRSTPAASATVKSPSHHKDAAAGPPRSAAVTQVTSAGSVTGRCVGDGPRLTTWAPKNGWSVVSVDRTGSRRSVLFGDGTTQVTVVLTCSGNTPVFDVETTASTPQPSETPSATPSPTVSVGGDAPTS
jgi:hypothetical protein